MFRGRFQYLLQPRQRFRVLALVEVEQCLRVKNQQTGRFFLACCVDIGFCFRVFA